MAKVSCYMSEDTIEEVKKLAEKEKRNFSKMMSELVEIGLKVKSRSNENDEDRELTEEEKWELIRRKMCYAQIQTLELVKDLFAANFNAERYGASSSSEYLNALSKQVKGYIDGLLEEVSHK